jgi:uncharacterized membrane protein
MKDMSRIWTIGFELFLVGFFLIFTGVVFMMASSFVSGDNVSTGVIIIVGPIPIVVGTGPHAFFVVFLAVVLTVFCLILFFFTKHQEK